MISERALRKWRKEALQIKEVQEGLGSGDALGIGAEACNRVVEMLLKMTQELLDQHLLRRKK